MLVAFHSPYFLVYRACQLLTLSGSGFCTKPCTHVPSTLALPAMLATTEVSICPMWMKRPLNPSSRDCLMISPTLPAGEASTLMMSGFWARMRSSTGLKSVIVRSKNSFDTTSYPSFWT